MANLAMPVSLFRSFVLIEYLLYILKCDKYLFIIYYFFRIFLYYYLYFFSKLKFLMKNFYQIHKKIVCFLKFNLDIAKINQIKTFLKRICIIQS
ncbi:MAG: hypothetical protein PWQ17_2435 [Anaerophaga sp.]|nr:hypothetical protein [Anaerophaga sp.]